MKYFFGKKSRNALVLVLAGSLGLHIVAIAIFGTIKFVSAVLREEQTFKAPPIEPPPQKEPEYTVNIQQRNKSSKPPRPNPIVVNNPTDIDIPALNIDVNVDSSSVYGRGGGGFGGGLRGIREMALNLTDFGYSSKVDGTLEGTLIDLKRDKNGSKIGGKHMDKVYEFTDGTWKVSNLTKKYYSVEKKLYASYWVIGNTNASAAPRAFEVEGEIEPTAILAYYEGQFSPDFKGRMRFCGMGDDVLIVKLGSDIVLDASWQGGYSPIDFKQIELGKPLVGFKPEVRHGEWIKVDPAKVYDLKILLGEIPGGLFGCYLFYQKEGDKGYRVFSTKPLTSSEKSRLRKVHADVKDAL